MAAFLKGQRESLVNKHSSSIPGPGHYKFQLPDKIRQPVHKFPKDEKRKTSYIIVKSYSLSPLHYNPDYTISLLKQPAYSFGIRYSSQPTLACSPGPGIYELRSQFIESKPLPKSPRRKKERSKSCSFTFLNRNDIIVPPKFGFKGRIKRTRSSSTVKPSRLSAQFEKSLIESGPRYAFRGKHQKKKQTSVKQQKDISKKHVHWAKPSSSNLLMREQSINQEKHEQMKRRIKKNISFLNSAAKGFTLTDKQ